MCFCSNSYEYVINLERNAALFFSRSNQSKRMANTPESKRKRCTKYRQLLSTPKKSVRNASPAVAVAEHLLGESFHLPPNEGTDPSSASDHLYCHSLSFDGIAAVVRDELHYSIPVNMKDSVYSDVQISELGHMQLKEAINSLSCDAKDICSLKSPSVLRETSVGSLASEDLIKKCVAEMSTRYA